MGAAGLYRSMLTEADEIRELASAKLHMPVLAVGGGSRDFTANTIEQVAREVTTLTLNGTGHYAAMEAPDRLAKALVGFYLKVDSHR
jgi:pimeloyl-ACP methyl ester carboxylesterase